MGKDSQIGVGPIIEIALAAEGQAPPAEFRIWPVGWINLRDGDRVLVDEAGMQSAVNRLMAGGVDLVIDFHHQSTPEFRPDNPHLRADRTAPAAGWCRLEARPDGLWAVKVRWTPQAAQQVADREFRYVSPAFWMEKQTGRLMEIVALSLTNRPATLFAEPLVAQQEQGGIVDRLREFLGKLAQALGVTGELTEDTALELAGAAAQAQRELAQAAEAAGLKPGEFKPEDLKPKVAELAAAAAKTGGGGEFRAKVAQAAGLKPEAAEPEILGAVQAHAAGAKGAGDLAERVAELEKGSKQAAVASLVNQALKEGKILASQKGWLEELAGENLAQATAYVQHAPRLVPLGDPKTAGLGPVKPTEGGLTPEAAQVASLMGNDPKKLAEMLAKEG